MCRQHFLLLRRAFIQQITMIALKLFVETEKRGHSLFMRVTQSRSMLKADLISSGQKFCRIDQQGI